MYDEVLVVTGAGSTMGLGSKLQELAVELGLLLCAHGASSVVIKQLEKQFAGVRELSTTFAKDLRVTAETLHTAAAAGLAILSITATRWTAPSRRCVAAYQLATMQRHLHLNKTFSCGVDPLNAPSPSSTCIGTQVVD